MYNKQLDTFLIVAQTGSFSKAAASMYLTPSAVIQQINSLEQNLQVSLFHRTKQGVTLTEAGEFLRTAAAEYTQAGRDIRRRLQIIASDGSCICVGTSFQQKIRLLYDVWVLFSKTKKDYQIKLINIEADPGCIREADVIEGLFDYDPWQKDWEFLKICDMEIGCALPKDHRLASRKLIRYEDLKENPIALMSPVFSETHRRLYEDVKSHGGTIIEIDKFTPYLPWECACGRYMLQTPLCWQDILADMVVIPCEWKYFLPYGFFYRRNCTPAVREFIRYTHELYFGENTEPVVPVF